MVMHSSLVGELVSELSIAACEVTLHSALSAATKLLGFDYFSLAYDKRSYGSSYDALLLHDFPEAWAKVYIGFELSRIDPVRRASERSMIGFEWKHIESFIPLTRSDRQILAVGRENGIGDGYTVPRHLPGDASGLCSFIMKPDNAVPVAMLTSAEIVGAVALTSARRILGSQPSIKTPVLSERQLECVLWSARGKTAGEIAVILGISEDTVIQHLKLARERYDVHCRQALILCTLFDGLIGFADIFEQWPD
jgi:LuxR family transcriptional regulator, quorum-sensing system regulator CciR